MSGKPDGKHRDTKKSGTARHAKERTGKVERKLREALKREAEDAIRASDNGKQR